MNKTVLKFVLFFFLSINFCNAQVKILLLSGKIKEVKQYEVKGDWIFYKKMDDPKDKMRKLDKYDVFSAINPDSTEEIIYDPDTTMEGDPSVDFVRRYIQGEQYGRAVYKKPWNAFEGQIVGAASGILNFYGPIVVFANSIIMGRFNPRTIPPSSTIEPEVFKSEEFRAGYNKYARNKKIKDTLIWGTIGFSASFAFLTIVLN
ncbi:MAG: hypothetical protein ABIT08_14350 [Bacteroidia bacterium]